MNQILTVKEKLLAVETRIAGAAARAGRKREDITLVGVTKKATLEAIREAYDAGLKVFGENKVQEAETKIPLADFAAEWHMIGHLQTNKIKTAAALFSFIQSVDSLRVAKALSRASAESAKTIKILLEVNISQEPQKYGFNSQEIYRAIEEIAALPFISIQGLMGMAPLTEDESGKRAAFKELKGLFSVCKSIKKENIAMRYLSMGMSDDFELAIEEGSNMVRIGRAIFS